MLLCSSQTYHGWGELSSSRVNCGQAFPPSKVVGRLDPQPLEHAGVKEAAKLAKAVQREHHGCSNEPPKELPKHIDEGCVPVAVEDLHPSGQLYTGWHQPERLQGLAALDVCSADRQIVRQPDTVPRQASHLQVLAVSFLCRQHVVAGSCTAFGPSWHIKHGPSS